MMDFVLGIGKGRSQRGKGEGRWELQEDSEPERSQIVCQRNKNGLGNWAAGV